MGIGFMVGWRCAFPIQSPSSSSSPPTPTRHHHPHHPPPVKGREGPFEIARASPLHSILEESDILHDYILRPYTGPFGALESIQNNYAEMEEVNIGRKSCGGSNNLNGMIKTKVLEDNSFSDILSANNSLQFRLLMENIDKIEDILTDSDLVRLERDILVQVGRLGALKLFHACLSRTHMAPDAFDLAFPLIEPKDRPADFPMDEQMGNIAVPSMRKEERKLRRKRASKKAAKLPALPSSGKVIHRERKVTVPTATDLDRPDGYYSRSRSSRLMVARNESKMSKGVKDVATLEKTRQRLEEKIGRAATVMRWAEAAGTDEKTLQQRLHYGWCCKDRLLKSTRSLVIYLARSYRGMGIGLDDLIQAGNIGVLKGAERFDPSRGYRFSTYAQYWIRKSMLGLIAQHSKGIKIPATMEKVIKQIQKTKIILCSREGRNPQDCEIAEFTGLSLSKVRSASRCPRVVGSIDRKIGDNLNTKVMDIIPDTSIDTPEETVERKHMRKDICKLLESLHPRERQVLMLRYGLGDGRCKSLEEIGRLFHVTKEWIRKIEKTALAKVRKEEIQGDLKHYLHI